MKSIPFQIFDRDHLHCPCIEIACLSHIDLYLEQYCSLWLLGMKLEKKQGLGREPEVPGRMEGIHLRGIARYWSLPKAALLDKDGQNVY